MDTGILKPFGPSILKAKIPDEIIVKLKKIGLDALPVQNLENALQYADKDTPLLITGSLYLAGNTLKFNETKID